MGHWVEIWVLYVVIMRFWVVFGGRSGVMVVVGHRWLS